MVVRTEPSNFDIRVDHAVSYIHKILNYEKVNIYVAILHTNAQSLT